MKKLLLTALVLAVFLASCSFPQFSPTIPTQTNTPLPSLTNTPSPTLTATATVTPTSTPTQAPEVRIASGDHALFNGDYETALSEYSTALNNSSDPAIQAAGLLGQGRIHYLSGIYPNALVELRQVTDNYPASSQAADAYFFLGETYMQLDRFSEAADAFASYLTIRPGILDAYISERRGDALSAAGDPSGALAAYSTAVQSPRLPPINFSLELKLAQSYVVLGDYTTAQVIYDDIFARTSAEVLRAQVEYARGQMFTALGQPDQATAAYLDAVFNYPQAYYSYLGLVELVNSGYSVDEQQRGLVDYYAGQYGVALIAFDRYLSTSPSDPSVSLYYKGLILRDQDQLDEAIDLWDRIIQGAPTTTEWDSAWEQKAYTQWAYLDDFATGEKTLLDFVATSPAHSRAAEFLFDAARVAERDDRLEDAAELWQRISSEYPESKYVYRALFLSALCYYRLGDYSSALTTFWQAQGIAASPVERAGAGFWIGKSQAAQGDLSLAQTTWQQTASIDPTGYYSERSHDLLNDRQPFASLPTIDLATDRQSELHHAVLWMQTTFNYVSSTDFSVPGPLAGDSRFTRGQEFWRLGLHDQAEAEFNAMREEASKDPLTSFRLAVFLSDLGMYRQAILAARQVLDLAGLDDAGTLTAPVLFSHIRFGAYFPDLVVPVAQKYNFDSLFVWSTLRQESLFDSNIQSSAGALGLMQIMPATGADIASRLGQSTDFIQSNLLRPDVNLAYGLDYLADQRDYLGGDLYAALAAYNGGPGNAASWQALAMGDSDLFVEVVRFDETRQYLMGIYEVFTIYSHLYARAQ